VLGLLLDKAIPERIASDGRISVSGADKSILTLKSKTIGFIIVESIPLCRDKLKKSFCQSHIVLMLLDLDLVESKCQSLVCFLCKLFDYR